MLSVRIFTSCSDAGAAACRPTPAGSGGHSVRAEYSADARRENPHAGLAAGAALRRRLRLCRLPVLSRASCPCEVRALPLQKCLILTRLDAGYKIGNPAQILMLCPAAVPSRMSTHDCAGDRLHQQPAAELAQLRAQPGTHLASLPIAAGQRAQIPGVSGPSLDISFSLRQGQSDRAGLLLRPWLHADSADAQPTAAAFIVDWQSQSLQVPQLCCCVGL